MKISIPFILGMSMLLMAITCAKEDDPYDEDDSYREAHYGKVEVSAEQATTDWNQFMKDAKTAILISEKNLHELDVKSSKAAEHEKNELCILHDATELKLRAVKQKLAARDKAFRAEVRHYDQNVPKRNDAFIKQLRRDLFDLNIEMEQKLED